MLYITLLSNSSSYPPPKGIPPSPSPALGLAQQLHRARPGDATRQAGGKGHGVGRKGREGPGFSADEAMGETSRKRLKPWGRLTVFDVFVDHDYLIDDF